MKGLIAEKWSKFICFPTFGRRQSKNSVRSALLFFTHLSLVWNWMTNLVLWAGTWDEEPVSPGCAGTVEELLLPCAWCSEGCW